MRRAKECLGAIANAGEQVGARFHAAANHDWLSDLLIALGKPFHMGTKGSRCTLAVDEEQELLPTDGVALQLGGVMRHVVHHMHAEVLSRATKNRREHLPD